MTEQKPSFVLISYAFSFAEGQGTIFFLVILIYLNRVSESTIQALSSQVEGLYLDHSRADLNETLTALITEAIVSPVLSPERLVSEMVMLIAILHGNVGSEIGNVFYIYMLHL